MQSNKADRNYKFSYPVRRKITGVRLDLAPCGIIDQFSMQPFALNIVLFTKPDSKGSKEIKNINNRKTII